MTKIRMARIITALVAIAVVVLGVARKQGYGTLCSFGSGRLSFTCPLGFLQSALASRSLLPELWLSVGLVVLITVVLGRVFCAWVCPTRLVRSILSIGGAEDVENGRRQANNGSHAEHVQSREGGHNVNQLMPDQARRPAYARYAVLGGTLVASFALGFPVFCLICPVGLFFGTIWAVIRLFWGKQSTLELLLFPALLGLEIVVLRSWCRSLCPLGGLLGLIGSVSRLARPRIVKARCLAAQGTSCRVCRKACPEGIDLVEPGHGALHGDCTRCLECYTRCPAGAIGLSLPRRRTRVGKQR